MSLNTPQKMVAKVLAALSLALGGGAAMAQDGFPQRVITIVNPYSPGTASDVVARAFSVPFGKELGQPVVVQNRDGAAGAIGMRSVAQSTPDGYTLAMSAMTPLVVQPHVVANLGFGPSNVSTVCNIAENILGIVVRQESPYKSMTDLIAASKKVSLSYGSAGNYSIPHVAMERAREATGGQFVHVPFRGDPPAIQDVLGGNLDFASIALVSGAGNIKAGKLRLLAVFSNRRHPDFTQVATMEELGIAATQVSYTSLYAPANTPPAVLEKLEGACKRVVASEDFQKSAASAGVVLRFAPRTDLRVTLDREYTAFGEVLKRLGAKPE